MTSTVIVSTVRPRFFDRETEMFGLLCVVGVLVNTTDALFTLGGLLRGYEEGNPLIVFVGEHIGLSRAVVAAGILGVLICAAMPFLFRRSSLGWRMVIYGLFALVIVIRTFIVGFWMGLLA